MTNTVLVDDHILLSLLLDDEPEELRPMGGAIATTGLWYHRLCRALANQSLVGSLSRRLGGIEAAVAADVIASVIELPPTIELVSLRELGWPMGQSASQGIRLNLLSLEAVAAARHLGAEICLATTDDNKPLVDAALGLSIPVRRLATTALAPVQRLPAVHSVLDALDEDRGG